MNLSTFFNKIKDLYGFKYYFSQCLMTCSYNRHPQSQASGSKRLVAVYHLFGIHITLVLPVVRFVGTLAYGAHLPGKGISNTVVVSPLNQKLCSHPWNPQACLERQFKIKIFMLSFVNVGCVTLVPWRFQV